MLNYAINMLADDYTRAMRRQRDWLVRWRGEVRRSLVKAREDAVSALTVDPSAAPIPSRHRVER